MPFHYVKCLGCAKTMTLSRLPGSQMCWTCMKMRTFDERGEAIE